MDEIGSILCMCCDVLVRKTSVIASRDEEGGDKGDGCFDWLRDGRLCLYIEQLPVYDGMKGEEDENEGDCAEEAEVEVEVVVVVGGEAEAEEKEEGEVVEGGSFEDGDVYEGLMISSIERYSERRRQGIYIVEGGGKVEQYRHSPP